MVFQWYSNEYTSDFTTGMVSLLGPFHIYTESEPKRPRNCNVSFSAALSDMNRIRGRNLRKCLYDLD